MMHSADRYENPGIKNPVGPKKNRERTTRSKAAYRAPRIRAKLNLVILSLVTN